MGRPISDLSDLERLKICELYTSKTPIDEIARAYDLSDGTVSGVAKRAGLPPRQRRSARALEDASFDIAKVEIEAIDGEPRVVDIVLGKALGYGRPESIRVLIKRLKDSLAELGTVHCRDVPYESGNGTLKKTQAYLLNLAQINYLITRCGLPRADEWCVQIARVFTAWQTGKLETADLGTAVDLQDGAETAAETAPGLHEIEDRFIKFFREQTKNLATKEDVSRVYLAVQSMMNRKDLLIATKREHNDTTKLHFNSRCPCCSENIVILTDDKVVGHYDHWTDCPGKNGAHETWLVCASCNSGFQSRRIDRTARRPEFEVYQKRRLQTVNSRQTSFLL